MDRVRAYLRPDSSVVLAIFSPEGLILESLGLAMALYTTAYIAASTLLAIVSLHFLKTAVLFKKYYPDGNPSIHQNWLFRCFKFFIGLALGATCILFFLHFSGLSDFGIKLRALIFFGTPLALFLTMALYLVYLLLLYKNKKFEKSPAED